MLKVRVGGGEREEWEETEAGRWHIKLLYWRQWCQSPFSAWFPSWVHSGLHQLYLVRHWELTSGKSSLTLRRTLQHKTPPGMQLALCWCACNSMWRITYDWPLLKGPIMSFVVTQGLTMRCLSPWRSAGWWCETQVLHNSVNSYYMRSFCLDSC